MDKLFLEGEKFAPTIDFNAEKGFLRISGQSYPEHTEEIFKPAIDWLEEYLTTPKREIVLEFSLSYFNTASARCFQEMLEMLEIYKMEQEGTVLINWYYQEDDSDMMESGEDYMNVVDLEINLIPEPVPE